MIKRLIIFLLVFLGLFYAGAGIYFYRKSLLKKSADVIPPRVNPILYNKSELVVFKELQFDFEGENKDNKLKLSSEKSHTGKWSVKINPVDEYGSEIVQSFSEIPSISDFRRIDISLKIFNSEIKDVDVWVIEIDGDDGKVLSWYSEGLPMTKNKWESFSMGFEVKQEFLKNFNHVKTYIWNKNKNTCYIDDVRIRFLGLPRENKQTLISSLKKSSFFFDLENDSELERTESLSDDVSHSGKRSSFMDGKNKYSVWICKTLKEVMNDTLTSVAASVWLYPKSDDPECTLVFEIRNSEGEQNYWDGKSTANMKLKADSWQKLNAVFNLSPEDNRKIGPEDKLCIYVLNNSKTKLYADDFEISYGGVADLRGIQTFVDMNSMEARAYQFDRYHPPFAVSYLQKLNIHNSNTHYLVFSDSLRYGDLRPDQYITKGNFTKNGNEELLVVAENVIEIYHFCENKLRFVLSGKFSIDRKFFPGAVFISGDFNGDGKDELIITSANNSTMYNFYSYDKNVCLDNFHELSVKILWSGSFIPENSKLLSGKFSGNKYDELFLASNTGICQVKKFTGNEWMNLSDDTVSSFIFGKQSTQVSGRYFTTTHDIILSVYPEKNLTKCVLYELKDKKLKIKTLPDLEMTENIFSPDDKLYNIQSKSNSFDDILAFNDQWRFELKYISSDKKGFFISSAPEFTGYAEDQNPKYYEFPRLVPGKFTRNETEILCLLRNCADNNFDGNRCNKYDSIPDLPNSVQLYNFSR